MLLVRSDSTYSHLRLGVTLRGGPGATSTGDIYLTIVLNGAIHSVMYTYYFVSMHTDKIW